ncbi:MAG: hypothetical protein NTZ16_06165 [Verrucomicrobia bacterium]|nr:hypothetical protein [Verrucomicrobiota bacterium]
MSVSSLTAIGCDIALLFDGFLGSPTVDFFFAGSGGRFDFMGTASGSCFGGFFVVGVLFTGDADGVFRFHLQNVIFDTENGIRFINPILPRRTTLSAFHSSSCE